MKIKSGAKTIWIVPERLDEENKNNSFCFFGYSRNQAREHKKHLRDIYGASYPSPIKAYLGKINGLTEATILLDTSNDDDESHRYCRLFTGPNAYKNAKLFSEIYHKTKNENMIDYILYRVKI